MPIDWDGFFNNGGYHGHLDPEGYAYPPYDENDEDEGFDDEDDYLDELDDYGKE